MRRCVPILVVAVAVAAGACSSGQECTYDIDCPGLLVCSNGACIEHAADTGTGSDDGGAAGDGATPHDSGRDAGGADAGRDGGRPDAGDAGLDAGDAGSDGGCVNGCVAQGDRECDGKASYRVCAADIHACLVWGPLAQCGGQDECREGSCGQDDCQQGTTQCLSDSLYATCNLHGTPFYTWGAGIPCASTEKCAKTICCPAVTVEVSGFCIDKFEAFAASQPDCGGTVYGHDADDYPAGFPDKVGDGGLPETDKVYACTAEAVAPSAYLTFFQAKRACENSGKRLCTPAEWHTACAGPGGSTYPYGNQYQQGTCNTEGNAALASGALPSCVSGYGVLDMSGNLYEWVFDVGADILQQPIVGGAYNSGTASTCTTQYPASSLTHSGARGWRCCR